MKISNVLLHMENKQLIPHISNHFQQNKHYLKGNIGSNPYSLYKPMAVRPSQIANINLIIDNQYIHVYTYCL